MVTKYDIFLYLGDKDTEVKTHEIMKYFKKRPYEYSNVYRLLSNLVKAKLAAKTKQGFQVKLSGRSQLLYKLITYCVSHGINYNYLVDRCFAEFIGKTLIKIEFTAKDFDIDPKTFKKYTDILFRYGLIVKVSQKPFKARIYCNPLFSNLLQYFGLPVLVKKEKKTDLLRPIKAELQKFNRNVSKNERAFRRIIEEYELRFIHSSLSLEGNPITLPDTIKILKDKIIPKDIKAADVEEIQNYQIALKSMMGDAVRGNMLSKEKILNFHFLAMRHKPEIAGKIREIPVRIKGNPNFKIASENKIEKLFAGLVEEYDSFVSKKRDVKDVLDFAAYFHNQFQFIHPFVDGNSRITRLVTFHLLQYFKIPILDIPLGLLDQYLSNTKAYKRRDDAALQKTLQHIVLYNLKSINEKLLRTE
ncbi:MAG: Fic family protein [Candidatus Woesearchaeota archaeon]